jgi:hypothetical protein
MALILSCSLYSPGCARGVAPARPRTTHRRGLHAGRPAAVAPPELAAGLSAERNARRRVCCCVSSQPGKHDRGGAGDTLMLRTAGVLWAALTCFSFGTRPLTAPHDGHSGSSGATRALPHIRQAQGSELSVADSAAAAPPPRGSPTSVAAGEPGGVTHKARRR